METHLGPPFVVKGKKAFKAQVKLKPESSTKYVLILHGEEHVITHKTIEWAVTEDKTLKEIVEMVAGNDNIEQLAIRLI